jgi:Glycosyl transferase family 2
MISQPAPICLFAYKRPRHLQQAIEALSQNPLATRSELVIYSDGPKSELDAPAVESVRSVCRAATGFACVRLVAREHNLGLAESVIRGVSEMCNTYGRVIVLEDDLLVSPFFLDYMNTALELYANDSSVCSIHGYVFPVRTPLPETFFLLGADCWGWATWSRAWGNFEPDGKKLQENLLRQQLVQRFNFNGAYDYSGMLRQQIAGQIDSWAIRWQASALLAGGLTLYPGRSLLRNIGFDDSGTHGYATSKFDVEVSKVPIQVDRIPLLESEAALAAYSDYYRALQPTGFRRRMLGLKRALRRIAFPR